MEENANNVKVTYAKNLNNLNFNTTLSTPIDANVNIKSILDINTFVFDTKTECGNGKAIVSGKIGLKALYIDTDNITNTLTDTQSFSESFVDSSITSDCSINLVENHISHNILSTEANLKVNCEVNLKPIVYMNLPLNTNSNYENMIVKKSEIQTNTISQHVNTSFEYTSNFETKDNITKILCHNAHYTNLRTTCFDNYAVAEGKLFCTLVYETQENEETTIKQLTDCFNLKTDIDMQGVTSDCLLDVNFSLDKFKESISTEVEDGNNVVTIVNCIKVCGICCKNVSIDVVDDIYSTENELELSLTKRDFIKSVNPQMVETLTSGEITLSAQETAIDAVIANLGIAPEITNTYVKDNSVVVEGLIASNLAYIDENKDYKHKACEIPFIINTKIATDSSNCLNSNLSVNDCKVKIKRGTIIELEYSLALNICVYEQVNKEMVDNIKIGKPLDFSNFDYQIYLAKPNETMWELCKRIKTTPENLTKFNKNLPLELTGKEKIIVKR